MAWLQGGLRRGTWDGFWLDEEEREDPCLEEITSLLLPALAISSCVLRLALVPSLLLAMTWPSFYRPRSATGVMRGA